MPQGEHIEGINAKRIDWCCQQTGVDFPKQLASAIKIKADKLEVGNLTYKQLAKVGKYFGHTTLFFLRDGRPAEDVHSPIFRTIANQRDVSMTPNLYKIVRNAERHRDAYVHFLEELKFPATFQPPALQGAVEDKARQTREWLGLCDKGRYTFERYRDILEQKGILVMHALGYPGQWKLTHPSVIGFAMPSDKVPLIFIKKHWPLQRDTFTMFHELGHILLHSKSGHLDSEESTHEGDAVKKEREANQFAGRCLVSDFTLKQIEGDIPPTADGFDRAFEGIAKSLGISVEVIVRRLLDKGRITQQQYAEYRKIVQNRRKTPTPPERGNRQYRHREPLHIFGHRYVRVVMDAANERKVSLNKAIGYLDNLRLQDIKKLEGHLLDV